MSSFNRDNNRAVWLDIPVADLDRSVEFYRHVLAIDVHAEQLGEVRFAVLEHNDGNGACLVVKPDEISGEKGLLVYLNTHGRIDDAVSKVAKHGGSVMEDTHPIGPHGFRALVLDSEGNRIALHSEVR